MAPAERERRRRHLLTRARWHRRRYLECLRAARALAPPRVQRGLEFIERHYREPITLAMAARAASMCPQRFSLLLLLATGRTFRQYVERRRVDHALALLTDADMKVLHVSEQVGFNSVATYYRAFRRQTGSTTTACRASACDAKLLQG